MSDKMATFGLLFAHFYLRRTQNQTWSETKIGLTQRLDTEMPQQDLVPQHILGGNWLELWCTLQNIHFFCLSTVKQLWFDSGKQTELE